jgi:hypothetical protein
LLPLVAALLFGLGSADAPPPGNASPGNAPAESGPPTTPADGTATVPNAVEEVSGPPGIPYVPAIGTASETRGVVLDLALDSSVRTRTLDVSSSGATFGTDVEIVPGIAIQLATPRLQLSLGYAPRVTIPVNVVDEQLAFLNRATLLASWRLDESWTLSAAGRFVFGEYSQLLPASTPGGAGPPPATLDPVRYFQTYPYEEIDTVLRLEGALSSRSRAWMAAGYFDQGGVGAEGEAAQPRAWGPKGELGFSIDSSRTTRWTTDATGQNWFLSNPSESIGVATLTEAWTERWSPEVESSLAAGLAIANRNIEAVTSAKHVAPVVRMSLSVVSKSRSPVSLSVAAALEPYVDTYARIPYQRVTGSVTLSWQPSASWQLSASFSGVLVPYTVKAPESYGTSGLSGSFALIRALTISLGAFTQAQFQGPTDSVGAFRQWTIYLSLTWRDTMGL